MRYTPEQRRALDALYDAVPSKDERKVVALVRPLIEAFEGAPPAQAFYHANMLLLAGPKPELFEAEREAWAARTGRALRELTGPLGE